jgi:Protein of unknown function (DUF1670)
VAAIVDDICTVVRHYYTRAGDLEAGQLIYHAPAVTERARRAKTIGHTKLVPVRLTIVADEDVDAIRVQAPAAVRREIRVRRLTHEAYDQGGVLSCADIGILTGYSTSAVSMTAVALRQRGELLPLRGYVVDMGSYPTHKAIIVRLYLQGLTTPAIAARTYHSKEAVDRYLRGFERVRLLAAKHPPRGTAIAHRHGAPGRRPVSRTARRAPGRHPHRPEASPCLVLMPLERRRPPSSSPATPTPTPRCRS